MSDKALEKFAETAAVALGLPLEPEWKAAVVANLDVTFRHAENVAAFRLSDEAEPAPVFKA